MEAYLNDLEGLRIAMDIENRGYNFYKLAYEKFSGQKVATLFKMLMEEENVHLDTFTRYFEEIGKYKEAHDTEYLFDPEISGYLTVLAEAHVFPTPEDAPDVLDKIRSPKSVLILAVNAEKDSVLFYAALAECSKFPQAREIFERLKKEEQGHVVKISNKIKALI
jgi:rubrerythrin